jgi:hypothetical protein
MDEGETAMNNVDVVNSLTLLGKTDVDGKPHAIYATRVSLFVPVLDEEEDNLKAAKIAAHELLYGGIIQSLRELKEKLPKTHHAKIESLIKKYSFSFA